MENKNIKTFYSNNEIFIAKKLGVCIRVSIPATTVYEWKNESEFIDLPLMDKELLDDLINALTEFKEMFNN